MAFAQLKNSTVYYEIHGYGEPLLLINGLKADHTGWLPVVDKLKKMHQVILFDNRGVGQIKDDGQPFSVDTMADDVAQLLDYLKIDSVFIAGHSLGGAVAQIIAYNYPEKVKKMSLWNTFIKLNDQAAKGFTDILILHELGGTPGDIMEAIVPWGFSQEFATPEFYDFVRNMSNSNLYPQSTNDYRRQLNALVNFNSSLFLKKINIPTLIIGSKLDIIALPEESQELANLIPNALLKIIPGGHASMIECPATCHDILSGFLDYDKK